MDHLELLRLLVGRFLLDSIQLHQNQTSERFISGSQFTCGSNFEKTELMNNSGGVSLGMYQHGALDPQ